MARLIFLPAPRVGDDVARTIVPVYVRESVAAATRFALVGARFSSAQTIRVAVFKRVSPRPGRAPIGVSVVPAAIPPEKRELLLGVCLLPRTPIFAFACPQLQTVFLVV